MTSGPAGPPPSADPATARAPALIEPVLRDSVLEEDIAAAVSRPDRFSVWWLGQSGFLIHWNGHRMLLDPYLSDSLTTKYAATDKPHVRMTARAIAPDRLAGIEAVTASHAHTDHLDGETLRPLAEANPGIALVLPGAVLETARERVGGGVRMAMIGLDRRTSTEIGPFRIHAIGAAHNDLAIDSEGRHLYLGFVIGFGPFSVYHSGDTLWHADLVAELLPFAIDLAILPINGNRPERRVAGNLNGTEAAALAKAAGARLVVPCHYDMFTFNTETPDEFTAACRRIGQPFRVLGCGEQLVLDETLLAAGGAP